MLAFGTLLQAQSEDSFMANPQNQTQNALTVNSNAMQPSTTDFLYDIGTSIGSAGSAGVTFVNGEFWVSKWASADINLLGSDGSFIQTFQVTGVTGTRGMTTNGTNVYIGNATTSIKIVDPITKTLTGTITSPVVVRYIAYDASLDTGNGGFWVGNFNTDIVAISMTGVQLSSIPFATHNIGGIYGLALDSNTNLLYAYSQSAPSNDVISTISLPSGVPTGVSYDVFANDLEPNGTTTSLAGGIFISYDVILGQSTIVGVSQATPSNMLFGINTDNLLANTTFSNTKASVYPNPASSYLKLSNIDNVNKVEIYNILGQNIKTVSVSNLNEEISVAELQSGTYFLKIYTNDNFTSKLKFVKQ